MKKIIRELVCRKKALTFCLVCSIIGSVIFALIPPLILERIINTLTSDKTIKPETAVMYFVMISASGLMEALQTVMITVFGQKITHSIRSNMCEKISRLPADYFTANEAGTITSRFVNDVDAVDSLFANGVIGMFADACRVISIIIIIFIKSTGLGILMLIVTPLLFLMTRLFQKRMLSAQMDNRRAVAKVNGHIPETIANIRMIHTFFKQKYMEMRYDDYITESYSAVDKSNFYDSVYSPIIIFTSSCVIAVMMIMSSMGGDFRAFFGMSVGTAVAVIAYVGKVFSPLESIGMEIENIQSAVAGVKRIDEFLNTDERKCTDSLITFEQLQSGKDRNISFDNVTFGYDDDRDVLNNVSFSAKEGEHITFTGRTGAGKSTIFKLILGLYGPDSGRVMVYGHDADAIPDQIKRRIFGCVEQSFCIVPGTVADQISLFDSSIDRSQIIKAAKLTGIHDAIMEMPNGYDTDMSNSSFSQGQLQLLSIARAIVTDPPVMLLDEITANLDSGTEKEITDALVRASNDRTLLSISHRVFEGSTMGRRIEIGGV